MALYPEVGAARDRARAVHRDFFPDPRDTDFGRRAARAAVPRQYPDRRRDDLSVEPVDDALHHRRVGVAGAIDFDVNSSFIC